jgi:hypothetical protein
MSCHRWWGTSIAVTVSESIETGRSKLMSNDAVWLRCQDTIRKLMLATGKDALVYAQTALVNETSEPERLKIFWSNARRFFDEYEAAR